MAGVQMNNAGELNFAGILIVCLVVGAMALGIGFMLSDGSTSYSVTNNDTVFSNITSSARVVTSISNNTANSFFGNKTTATQQTAFDRMIGTSYGSILVIGSIPGVFINIVGASFSGIGLSGYDVFLIAAILAIIIGIVLFLTIGRR